MGWLLGLPLGIFRLLLGFLTLALRLAVPIALIVALVVLYRRSKDVQTGQSKRETPKEPEFKGPVYTVDYREVDEDDAHEDFAAGAAAPAGAEAGVVPAVAVVLLPWQGDPGADFLPPPAERGDL